MQKFDEYKFFADSTQRLSERRLTASQTFITVNTVVFAALSFTAGATAAHGWERLLIALPLVVVGIAVCVLWRRMIGQYRALIDWRYDQLVAMESEAGMEGCHQLYTKEMEQFYSERKTPQFGFSKAESWLPLLFVAAYIAIGLGIVGIKLANT